MQKTSNEQVEGRMLILLLSSDTASTEEDGELPLVVFAH